MSETKEYVVNEHRSNISHQGKALVPGSIVTLTDAEYNRLPHYFTPKAVEDVKSGAVDYDAKNTDELKVLADAAGIVIEQGSGANGNVVKADYVAALKAL